MSVIGYYLNFTKLSEYVPSLVSDPRDEMSRFVMGVCNDLKDECCSTMLEENMNILSHGSCSTSGGGKC